MIDWFSAGERESEREARAVWVVVVVRWRLLSELQQVVERRGERTGQQHCHSYQSVSQWYKAAQGAQSVSSQRGKG